MCCPPRWHSLIGNTMVEFRAWLLAVLVLAVVPPVASAQHCETALAVYARASAAPGGAPHVGNARLFCLQPPGLDAHELPAHADQVMVRINSGMSPTRASIWVTLDGLGFVAEPFRLYRTELLTGPVYQLPDWLYLRDGDEASGELVVTLQEAGYYARVVYHKDAMPIDAPVL